MKRQAHIVGAARRGVHERVRCESDADRACLKRDTAPAGWFMKAWNFEAPAEAAAPDILDIRNAYGELCWWLEGVDLWDEEGVTARTPTGVGWGDLAVGWPSARDH